jgi:WD repeat-containing protein 23
VCARRGGARVLSPAAALALREAGAAPPGAAGRHTAAFHRVPERPAGIVDAMRSRAYIGRFTADGSVFVAAFQNERRIRMYDAAAGRPDDDNDTKSGRAGSGGSGGGGGGRPARGWPLLKDIHARNLRWTVTDVALSPDQAYLLYASITPVVHLVRVARGGGAGGGAAPVESVANVTDIHEALHLGCAGWRFIAV